MYRKLQHKNQDNDPLIMMLCSNILLKTKKKDMVLNHLLIPTKQYTTKNKEMI